MSVRRVPAAAAISAAELSLLLTSDREIQKINREWRKKDKATDVLSFPGFDPAELTRLGKQASMSRRLGRKLPPWSLGDIIISVETAARQAEERGETLVNEIDRLFVHGLVHLFGYDHELGAKDARRMQRVERYLLTRP